MEEKIIIAATEQFLNYGFKSVTMDDIANELGMSKKTIYAHFSTKHKLVEASTNHLFNFINEGILEIRKQQNNPIVELYEIKRFTMNYLKDEKTSPQYQLHKYYPKIYADSYEKQFELMHSCLTDNMKRGIESGHYREDVPIDFVNRIHFIGIQALNDKRLFPAEEYTHQQLKDQFLEYHLRAITTQKGLQTLKELISSNE